MKIETVKVSVLRVTLKVSYEAAGQTIDAFWHVLAEVTTTDGVHGFGYVVALASSLVPAIANASRELGQLLVGMHVLEPEAAWERLARKGSGCLIAPKAPGLGLKQNQDAVRRFTHAP